MSARFLDDLSKRLIAATGDLRSGSFFRQRLGVAVQKGNALAVMSTMDRGQCLLEEGELDGIVTAGTASSVGLSV